MIRLKRPHRGGPESFGGGHMMGIRDVARSFDVLSGEDADGALRATLLGEIDIAVEDEVIDRLGALTQFEERVRLDLSQLRFIDSHGMDAVVAAITGARRDGCELEVDDRVSPSVARIVQYTDAGAQLWP